MFRTTVTGSLVAASLTASALMLVPAASATPTFVSGASISGSGALPTGAAVAMSENGNAVATWIRNGRVMASSSTHGSWGGVDVVSPIGASVSEPVASMNDQGEAVLAWVQVDGDGDKRVAASRLVNGQFGVGELVSQANTLDVAGPVDLGLDGAGKAFAAYRISNGTNVNQVRVTTWDKAGTEVTTAVSDTSAFNNSISVNQQGQALLAYYDRLDADEVVQTRRYNPATKSWAGIKSVGLVGQYGGGLIDTSLSDTGNGTVAYVKQSDGDYRALVNRSAADGSLKGASFASAPGYSISNVDLDENDKGAALLTYLRVGNGIHVGYTQRSDAGNWTTPAIVDNDLADSAEPQAAISDSGFAFIGWEDDGHQLAAYRGAIYQGMTTYDSGAGKWAPTETAAGIDNQGNVLLAGVLAGGDPATGIVSGKFLDTAGPASGVVSLPTGTLSKTIKVTRAAADRFSNLGNGSIRVRSARYDGDFGAPKVILSNSPATSVDFAATPGFTYCFSSLAKDTNGNTGAWSSEKCTTTALDDRSLYRAKTGFKRKTSGTAYLGTYTKATTKGAKLVVQHVKARKIAIVVSRSTKGGTIKVSYGGTKFATFKLKGTGNQQILAFKDLGSLKTGYVAIKVISKSGKSVKIDGIIAAR